MRNGLLLERSCDQQGAHSYPQFLSNSSAPSGLLLRKILWLLATLAASLPAVAGSTSASLSVNITLTSPPTGVCTSALLSDGTGAIVRVSCQTGEVVSISP